MKRCLVLATITALVMTFAIDNGHSASVESQLQDLVRETRKSLPMRIGDGEVQATNVAAVGKIVIATYNFMMPISALGNLSEVKAFYYRSSLNTVCTSPDTFQSMKLGVSYINKYFDINNKFVMEFTIDLNTCREMQ